MLKNWIARRPFTHGFILGTVIFLSVYLPLTTLVGPEPIGIRGQSMFPTLRDGGKCIFYNKFTEVNRGDIVALYHGGQFLCKRVIGIPGDEIVIAGEIVVINGQEMPEYFVACRWGSRNIETYKVPANHYFVMGDNRAISMDSRHIGYISRDNILSKLLWNWSW